MKNQELKAAINFTLLILNNNNNINAKGIAEMWEIKAGNKQVILEHLKAINAIYTKAIKQLNEEIKDEKRKI